MDYEKRARGIIDAASASEGVIREVDYDLALEAIEETLRESYEAGRDEARAELRSLRGEIATIFGVIPQRGGMSENACAIAHMGEAMGRVEKERDEARAEVARLEDLNDAQDREIVKANRAADEARAEVDSWRESSDAGWAKFDECRDDLKEARAEVARLRDLLLTGEWGRHVDDGRTFLRVYVADGADLSCRATREDAINAVLAAADTNKEGGA